MSEESTPTPAPNNQPNLADLQAQLAALTAQLAALAQAQPAAPAAVPATPAVPVTPVPVAQTPATAGQVTAPVLNVAWVGREGLLGGYKRQASELHFQDKMEFVQPVKDIVKTALRTKIWRGTQQEGVNKLQALSDALTTHLGIPQAIVEIHPAAFGTGPNYHDNICTLDKVSLVSLLHELAHHILRHLSLPQDEVFPRAFSLGLYKATAPRLFEAARVNGRLLFTDGVSERESGSAGQAVQWGGRTGIRAARQDAPPTVVDVPDDEELS